MTDLQTNPNQPTPMKLKYCMLDPVDGFLDVPDVEKLMDALVEGGHLYMFYQIHVANLSALKSELFLKFPDGNVPKELQEISDEADALLNEFLQRIPDEDVQILDELVPEFVKSGKIQIGSIVVR